METVYVGGAGLWGEATETDLALESEIREHADVFHQNIMPEFVPKAIGAASFFTGNTIHDVFSSCHAEALMSGCISVTGHHPIYAERPGFSGKSVASAVETIERLTDGFTQLPCPELSASARQWAAANLSYETFRAQLTDLLRSLWTKDSTPTSAKTA